MRSSRYVVVPEELDRLFRQRLEELRANIALPLKETKTAACSFHNLERFRIGRAQYSALGDDGGDVLGWGHVEGWVADAYAVGRYLLAGMMRDFLGRALLDGDLVAGGGGEVDRGPRGRDVERDAVFAGQNGDVVGADLVG